LRKGILQTLKFLGFLAIGTLLLWFAFRNVDFKSLANGLKEANYWWILLSILFGIFAYVSRARRWVLLIHPLGYSPSVLNTFYALMTGYLANIALPRVGEFTRCVALGKKEKIPVDQLVGTVVVERTIDFISLLIIMIIMLITSGDLITDFFKESIVIPIQEKVHAFSWFLWAIWGFLIGTTIIILYLLIRFKRNLRKLRFFSKFYDIARGIVNGLKTIIHMERKWEFIFHTVFIWVNYTLMTWVVVFAIDSTSHLTLNDSVFLLVIGGLAMSAPVQSGLGAFHYIISRGLAYVEGVKIEDGLVYAILTHESQLIFITIVGAISFFLIFHVRRRIKDGEE
jgi:uncharacterized protein (TIRG00374 family)